MGGMGVGWEVEVGMGGEVRGRVVRILRAGEGLLLWWVGWDGDFAGLEELEGVRMGILDE